MFKIDFHPTERKLRHFGFVALPGCSFLALAALFEKGPFSLGLGTMRVYIAITFAIVGLLCGFSSLVCPAANKPVYIGLSVLSFPIGLMVSLLTMVTLFFVVFGIVATVIRIVGRDTMGRHFLPTAASYWNKRINRPTNDAYFRQF